MGEIMGLENPEELLQKMRQIYSQREEEFLLRDQAYQEKGAALQAMVKEIAATRNTVEERESKLNALQEEINQKEKSLEEKKNELERNFSEKENALEDRQAKIQEQELKIKEQEKSLIMKYNLELETVRNEEMRLKRLTEEYDYKLSLLDEGMVETLQHTGDKADLTKYMLLKEHDEMVTDLNKKIQSLQAEKSTLLAEHEKTVIDLNKKLEGAHADRTTLMKKIVELNTQSIATPELENPQQQVSSSQSDTGQGEKPKEAQNPGHEAHEELTAEVLLHYLEKNEPKLENVSIKHSGDGEQLQASCGRLQYRFLFTKPAQFDLFAERKKNSQLRKVLEQLNKDHPGVQFRYAEAEGCVFATGYFTQDINSYELMERVKKISNCFHQD